jgi:hypothetical protein
MKKSASRKDLRKSHFTRPPFPPMPGELDVGIRIGKLHFGNGYASRA